MKKTIRLTESDLVRLVKRVIKEQGDLNIEFDSTKKGSSEPKKGQSINPNKEAFEKIKAALIAFKKPSKVDTVEFNGVHKLTWNTLIIRGIGHQQEHLNVHTTFLLVTMEI